MNLIFVLSLSLYALSAVRGQLCGNGEEFNSCGTACPSTCNNYNNNGLCTANCVQGCFCAGDKVRATDGRCVEITECQTQCPENQKYECGTECPDTCDNFFQDRSCIESCRYGCFCKQGYVLRNETANECVHTSECTSRLGCRINEHYDRCGSVCPKTCITKDQNMQCIQSCEPGCFCNDGYILHNDSCVTDSSCALLIGQQGGGAGVKFSVVLIFLSTITALCLF